MNAPRAPIIVSALFGASDFAFFDGLRRQHFPSERNVIAAHLTMFHHLAPDLAPELKQRLVAETRGIGPPRARIGGLINLGQGVAFRIESPELEDIRARLAEAFGPMLTPQDRAGWRPHVTIQNKVLPAEAKELIATGRGSRHARSRSQAWRAGGTLAARGSLCRAICSPLDPPRASPYAARSPSRRAYWGEVAQLVRARES